MAKVAGCYRTERHACRDLTKLIKRTNGVTLDIPISVCKLNVRMRKPVRCMVAYWPVLKMSDWCKFFVRHRPEMLLGGHKITGAWRPMFAEFWANYRQTCGDHPLFRRDFDFSCCVPFMVHGDEGRGQLRRPYLVVSWQSVIGHLGPHLTTEPGTLGVELTEAISFWIFWWFP